MLPSPPRTGDDLEDGVRRQALALQRAALQVQQPGAQHDVGALHRQEVQVQVACRGGWGSVGWFEGRWVDLGIGGGLGAGKWVGVGYPTMAGLTCLRAGQVQLHHAAVGAQLLVRGHQVPEEGAGPGEGGAGTDGTAPGRRGAR